METYTELKPLAANPRFAKQREKALKGLDFSQIDKPILDIVKQLAEIPYLFSLQSCYGHFLHEKQKDPNNLERLTSDSAGKEIDYRIAYFAFCLENNEQGRDFLQKLEKLASINPDYIQCGCADWFWKRRVNTYVIQVEPDRFKNVDRCFVDFDEALILQDVRDMFFEEFRKIL